MRWKQTKLYFARYLQFAEHKAPASASCLSF